jgi:hypothetical protein
MTTKDIIDHLDSKPYLDHRIKQLNKDIADIRQEVEELEDIRRYVRQVTEVIDGIPVNISRKNHSVEIRTVVVGNEGYRWGHWYKTVLGEDDWRQFGVCINGKGGHWGGGDNLFQGDILVGFYRTIEEAERVLMNWIINGKTNYDF